uniref:UBX domain-containing protein 4 n=1 Tax=Setaria digitata TaxID=48799 RepID=A0A915PJV0_9BILA
MAGGCQYCGRSVGEHKRRNMKWFEGGIAEAIAESRQCNALFIVNIQHPPESNDEQSIRMAQLWDSVDNDICQPALVGIRIFYGTETAKQFAQIYPVSLVPASYVIDLKGKPLDIITVTAEMDEDVFAQRLKIAMKRSKDSDNSKCLQLQNLNVACQSSSTSSAVGKSNKEGAEKEKSAAAVMDEKIKRARQLLEKKHEEDEVIKKNEEKQKEIERRNLGKLMADAKTSREERERQEIMERKNREKREQEAYLKRLRQQIKADKEERMNGMMRNMLRPKKETKHADHGTNMQFSVSDSTDCRIQCKFSDGSTLVRQFASTDIFSQLVEIIKQDGREGEDFYIVQMYPRREFPDTTKTFGELGLTPSATVLILSKRKRTVTNYSGSRWIGFLQYAIAAPFQALYRILLYIVGYNGHTSATSTIKSKDSSTVGGSGKEVETNECEGWNPGRKIQVELIWRGGEVVETVSTPTTCQGVLSFDSLRTENSTLLPHYTSLNDSWEDGAVCWQSAGRERGPGRGALPCPLCARSQTARLSIARSRASVGGCREVEDSDVSPLYKRTAVPMKMMNDTPLDLIGGSQLYYYCVSVAFRFALQE